VGSLGTLHYEHTISETLTHKCVTRADEGDPVKAYNAYNLTRLKTDAPYINWSAYFSGFTNRTIPSPIIISAPSYFLNLTSILEETDDGTLEAYFVWTAIKSLSVLLGPNETARKEVRRLSNHLSGIENGVEERREDVCLQSLLDNYAFMIGRYYVKRAFSGESVWA
jgi:endothelin-converting enzyme